MANHPLQGPVEHFTSGFLSKVFASFSTYPYSLVKTRLQVSPVFSCCPPHSPPTHPLASFVSFSNPLSSCSPLQRTSRIHTMPFTGDYGTPLSRSIGESPFPPAAQCLCLTLPPRATAHLLWGSPRHEGWMGFYKGVVPNTLKVAPSTAVTFVAYEQVSRLLHHL